MIEICVSTIYGTRFLARNVLAMRNRKKIKKIKETNMENLKKCPICNNIPISFVDETTNSIVLRCPDIDCNFPYAVGDINKELAIKRWNQCCEQWDKENKTNMENPDD